ncbi:aspartate ammonia-lyase [Secundilactobacillus pentosiphilus]|uniref:Aspartate ammonia-lyase n=1 Tax=Secundilactobacillus pentosiphilus TaxID=1714682 RepID=A0A1Z5IQK3_9LACO|nr:aspartate ammonia-lyase [Secundilactobacillus pentosiphilus]GAX03966.1 aspartate ammonia-lyase [Secundilactobacillus pentosiphilus]
MRIEQDCIGKLAIDDDALYGIHSKRAVKNFPISNEKVHPLIIESFLQIKKAAAQVNRQAGTLSAEKASTITAACNQLLLGQHQEAFIVPAIQGSAGTSANMNVNEVVAHLAEALTPGIHIHPNDDVNQSQSTNDTFPTAGQMAMLKKLPSLLKVINGLLDALEKLAQQNKNVLKVGRTQLQDAVPTTYGRTFAAYRSLFKRDLARLSAVRNGLAVVNLGGTAIGTGLNATRYYQTHIVEQVNQLTQLNLVQASDLIDATQNCDIAVAFSGALKALAVDLSKFANDLRLLGSGPQAGLVELHLPAVQAGSSIMPAKVNPVIPEVVNQVAFEVIGNDTTVTLAAQGGQLELNAFEPIMFRDILASETYLERGIQTLVTNCLNGLQVNRTQTQRYVEHSAIVATVLSPILGYTKTTALIKQALHEDRSVREIILDDRLLPAEQVDRLLSPESLLHGQSATKRNIKEG